MSFSLLFLLLRLPSGSCARCCLAATSTAAPAGKRKPPGAAAQTGVVAGVTLTGAGATGTGTGGTGGDAALTGGEGGTAAAPPETTQQSAARALRPGTGTRQGAVVAESTAVMGRLLLAATPHLVAAMVVMRHRLHTRTRHHSNSSSGCWSVWVGLCR